MSLPQPSAGGAPSLRRGVRRGAAATAVLGLSVLALSACGAGNDSQTSEIHPDNAATSVGDIRLQNVAVVTQANVNAPGPASVTARIFNTGRSAQQLKSVTVTGSGTHATLKPVKGSGAITIPADGSVLLGGKNNPSAVISSGREAVQDGNAQSLSFDFSRTGTVKLRALVLPAKGNYASFGPSQSPTSSANSTPTGGNATPGGKNTPNGKNPSGTKNSPVNTPSSSSHS